MVRLNIIVEGQTEETFINKILRPHLGDFNVFVTARRVETGRNRGKIFRGGNDFLFKGQKRYQIVDERR